MRLNELFPRVTALGVDRPGYYHTGISLGDGTIVHYYGEHERSVVSRTSIGVFVGKSPRLWEVVPRRPALAPGLTILLALASIGRQRFDIWRSNCEHFTHFCLTGRMASAQVTQLARTPIRYVFGSVISVIGYYCRRCRIAFPESLLSNPISNIASAADRYFFLADAWLAADGKPCFRLHYRLPSAGSLEDSRRENELWCVGVPEEHSSWVKARPPLIGERIGRVVFDESLSFTFISDSDEFSGAHGLYHRVNSTCAQDWIPRHLKAKISRPTHQLKEGA